VEEDPETGVKRTVKNGCGTPQGGVIWLLRSRSVGLRPAYRQPISHASRRLGSPLLANLYLDGLDKAVNGGKQMKAVMVRYGATSLFSVVKGRERRCPVG
jgi:hypothetical protein